VIDVAHATMKLVEAAGKASKTPLILSHTAVAQNQPAEFSRRVSPAHAKLVASTGGVVGVWGNPSTFKSLGDYVDAIARAVDVAGLSSDRAPDAHAGLLARGHSSDRRRRLSARLQPVGQGDLAWRACSGIRLTTCGGYT